MDKVLIVANGTKQASYPLSAEMKEYLEGKAIQTEIIYTDQSDEPLMVPFDVDLVITLGGDGTVLAAARAVHELGIPILPVNLGTFGYITEISKEEWQEALDQFMMYGDNISRRQMLRITVYRDGDKIWQASALNEAVISSSGRAKVISMELFLDNTSLGKFRADGMIVATATGSTGYSLAAGGPILDAEMSALVITPVCPFTLSNRPLVTSGKIVSITVSEGQRTDIILSADGQLDFFLKEGDRVNVEKSLSRALLVKSLRRNFTEVVRDKLNWSGVLHA